MSLPKLYKHFKLTPQKLKEILNSNNIEVDLRFIKEIPKNWIEILSSETGLPKMDLNAYVAPKKETTNKEKVINASLESLVKIKQDLQEAIPNTKYHIAYVKFVANDRSHAFVRSLKSFEEIYTTNLKAKTEDDFIIKKDCQSLDFNQIVLCNINSKYKYAEINKPSFKGFACNIKKKTNFTFTYVFKVIVENSSYIEINVVSRTEIKLFKFYEFALFYESNNYISSTYKEIPYQDKIEKFWLDFKIIIEKNEIDIDDVTIINLIKNNYSQEEFENAISKQFNKDVENLISNNVTNDITCFIEKWKLIKVEWLTIYNLQNLHLKNIYFELWVKEILPLNFWDDQFINALLEINEFNQNTNIDFLNKDQKDLLTDHLKVFYASNFRIESLEIFRNLISISKTFLKEQTNEFILIAQENCVDEVRFQLWIENKTAVFPKEYAITAFEHQEAEIQIQIIKALEVIEIIPLLHNIKPNEDSNCQLKLHNVSNVIIDEVFKTLCLDLETNTRTIYEMAWIENNTSKIYNENSIEEGINLFKSIADKKENTIIGQNIIAFDCVELQKHGIEFTKDLLWDTFLIEMVLSPEMKNFALKTRHNAVADVELTLKLFYNQILRIVHQSEEELELLYQYISKDFKLKISELKAKANWGFVSTTTLNEQKLKFFRPQPTEDTIILKLEAAIKENEGVQNVIIVPENLKKSLYSLENATYISTDNKKDFGVIDITKVKRLPANFNWTKVCLENHYNYSISKKQTPYWGNIAPAVKIKIEEELDIFSVLSFKEDYYQESNRNLIVNTNEFYTLRENFIKNKDFKGYIINKDLIVTENKKCLKTLEITEVINAASKNHFWMKFTGGNSFLEISKEECGNRGIEIPESFDNFWIEKQDFTGFQVWGNFNLEKLLKDIFPHRHYFIDSDTDSEELTNTYYPNLKIEANANEEFVSFNPETNYRSRYWLFQKEVLLQIQETNTPTLLVIQNKKEIQQLEHYFRRLEFYIPSNEATMARRMELLHQNPSAKKMVLVHLADFDKAIQANYLDKINVVLESLKLFENYFVTKNSSLFNNCLDEDFKGNKESAEEINEEEENENEQNPKIEIKKPLLKDFFFHLKLQTPIIQHIKNNVRNNFEDNKLWILDPRTNEYSGISEIWSAKSRTILIGKELDFDKQLEIIENYIEGPKSIKELPFDLEKAKAILSDIFLNGQPWYKEQEPYLDDIIPAKMDRLITLPTGGGKSLLFQGPAILRSAFTNKLTIVITPLKALMQDQVEALWDKGFHGCVDYLNSDRGTDTRIIYRAMAGGEVSLLFITPERFRSRGFKNALNVRLKTDGGLEFAVFDEAHCVSQWGHEFRPDYFNSAKEINGLKKVANEEFPLLLFSATVSKKIYEDFNTIFS